jgi:hypothetical protein
VGHGDRVDVGKSNACRVAGALDGGDHRLEVGAAGDLGYDAAEARVLVDTARDGIG